MMFPGERKIIGIPFTPLTTLPREPTSASNPALGGLLQSKQLNTQPELLNRHPVTCSQGATSTFVLPREARGLAWPRPPHTQLLTYWRRWSFHWSFSSLSVRPAAYPGKAELKPKSLSSSCIKLQISGLVLTTELTSSSCC